MITFWPCHSRYQKSGTHPSQQPNYFSSSTVMVSLSTSTSIVWETPFKHKAYWYDHSIHRVWMLIVQIDVSLAPEASHFAHHHVVARSSFTRQSLSKKSRILVSSVSKPIRHYEKLLIFSWGYSYFEHLPSTTTTGLSCLLWHFWALQEVPWPWWGSNSMLYFWSSSRDHVQFDYLHKVTFQIALPPFSQFGTCSESHCWCICLYAHAYNKQPCTRW